MDLTESIGTKIEPETKERLEEIAIKRSEPGNRITVSEVVREILREEVQKQEMGAA
jgi:predicted transcriptional regulator